MDILLKEQARNVNSTVTNVKVNQIQDLFDMFLGSLTQPQKKKVPKAGKRLSLESHEREKLHLPLRRYGSADDCDTSHKAAPHHTTIHSLQDLITQLQLAIKDEVDQISDLENMKRLLEKDGNFNKMD